MDNPQNTFTALDIRPVDDTSSIPLYQQVRIDLLNILQSEQLLPGQMLPTEKELAKAYQVSRQTIRQAISDLAASDLLERTPGRGTTVLSGRNRLKFFLDKSFAQQIMEKGLQPHSEVLRLKETTIDNASPLTLRHKQGSSALELIRLRYGNDTPIGLQYTTIITDLCPDLASHDFRSASLYNLLLTKYKIPIVCIDQSISAVIADEWHQTILKVTKEIPLLYVHTTAYLANHEPIEASTSYYRADKYEFDVSQNFK